MSLKQRLNSYLTEGGYFNQGISLLKELNHNAFEVKEIESYSQLPFAPKSVRERLNTIIKEYYLKLGDTPQFFSTQTHIVEDVKTEPAVIQNIRKEAKQAQDDRRSLHSSLLDIAENRAEKCFEIKRLTKKIDKLYNTINEYELTGILPVEVVEKERSAVDDVIQLNSKILSLRPRISRLKKWLSSDDIGTTKRKQYSKELSDKEKELEELLLKINQLRNE